MTIFAFLFGLAFGIAFGAVCDHVVKYVKGWRPRPDRRRARAVLEKTSPDQNKAP